MERIGKHVEIVKPALTLLVVVLYMFAVMIGGR